MSRIPTSKSVLAMTVLAPGLFSTTAFAAMVDFHAVLNTASEVPPHSTQGTGTAMATLDTATKMLTYTVTYKDLTGPVTAAHFHGPAMAGVNAGVVLPIATSMTPIKDSTTLTDAQIADLEAGKWYVNIHTAANPGGEIRGQMEKGK